MKKKSIFIVCIISVSLLIASSSVSFGSDKDICKKQIDYYLKIKMNDGLLPGDEFNPYDYKGVAAAAKAMLANEKKRTHNDKNHAAITKLVIGHLADIEEAASKAVPGSVESAGHSLRFLYLSCKACHKVYRTEKRLRP
ncbi:MAG: hypothetical protein ACE5GU_03520 [Candidatus Scalinduaceae bacterium]